MYYNKIRIEIIEICDIHRVFWDKFGVVVVNGYLTICSDPISGGVAQDTIGF